MQKASRNFSGVDRGVANRSRLGKRSKRKRQYQLESLESRTLLSYTFTGGGTNAGVATGDGNADTLYLEPFGGLIYHSTDGIVFSPDWGGGLTIAASTANSISVFQGSAANAHVVRLGGVLGATSSLEAHLIINDGGPLDSAVVDDSLDNQQAIGANAYTVTSTSVTGPPTLNVSLNGPALGAGLTLLGGTADNTFDVNSTLAGEPVSVVTAAATTSTVNVGSGGTVSLISSPVAIYGASAASATTVNINDASDTSQSEFFFDSPSANPSAPYQVALTVGNIIQYGPGVTAVNFNGGTFGATGVDYQLDQTQAGTTTTINAGPNTNSYFVAGSTAVLDGNLLGPVVINGGGAGDRLQVSDFDSAANDNYTITSSTITSTGTFAGLTYGGLGAGGSLFFYASTGDNVIDINGTADDVATTVGGEAGTDTINVNGTGTGGSLNIQTGNSNDQTSTVNVLADSEPVNISSFANNPVITTVNIGSTGGPGTMAEIQGPISVVNTVSLTALNFHDENDTTGQTWTLDNDDSVPTGTVAVTGSATTTYNPAELSELTVNGGSGGNTFTVDNTSGFYPTTLNTGTGDDTTNVFATGDNTLDINGQDGMDTVTLGGLADVGMQDLSGFINIANDLGLTNLVLDDSQDTTGQTGFLINDGTNGLVSGLSPATINYSDGAVASMTVDGGSGGNTFTVFGTLANAAVIPAVTDLFTGTGDDATVVEATAANSQLNIHGFAGMDTVSIGFFGSLTDILGPVLVDNEFGFTGLTVDASADLVSHDLTLSSSAPDTTLVGLAPATITYVTLELGSLTLNTSDFGTQVMNIDMSGDNPIPDIDTPGLTWNAGADATSAPDSHALNIFGELPTGPFASETHNANDQTVFPQVGQYGSIDFDDGQGTVSSLTSLDYTGLQPITDTTPAIDYTFTDSGYPDQSFSATTGPIVGGFQTIEFANTPTPPSPTNFETTDIANKNFVTFNTPSSNPAVPGNGILGTVNVPIPSDGLLSLTFNTTTGGDNIVSFVNTPPGVVTSYFDGAGPAITDVTGLGVADGTVLFLNGGAGVNTLNYDAGGETPTITPGLLPGEVLISIPGAGIVDAINYTQINITGVTPPVITPGPATTINSVEGFQLVDAIVGTFTVPITPILTSPPFGLPASDFTASIDWGDPSPDPDAGVITQDASNPSVYYITGTHTFLENGTYTVGNTVVFNGGTITSTVGGVPVSLTFGPSGPTTGTPATANVTQGTLAVSAFPIVGTEGLPIAAQVIGTFIDAGGADPIGNYSAAITILDSAGVLVVSVPATDIVQLGNSAQFDVLAPAITLPEEGTYSVYVSVTDSGGTTPVTAAGASTAVIADAPLTAGPAVALSPNTGVKSSGEVASFTDANPTAPTSDFTAVINWGDGTAASAGAITQPGGVGTAFEVTGSHIYATPGSYTTTVVVTDVGGSVVTLVGTATVTDLPVSGATANFTATEGQSTGLFVLATFTDPNTLATVASVNATLAVGGWGDGTPTTAGVTLVVQEIGVTPLTSATNPGAPIFEVLGTHTYAEETAAGLPDTLSVIITTLGGATTTLTSPPGGGVTVRDASLTGSNGTEITGIEGSTTAVTAPNAVGTLLGSFTDANQGATTADFLPLPTGNGGSVVVNWGDGSALQTLGATNLTANGSPNGVVFTINASHDYVEEGTYAYTVTVTDDGGSTTTISGSAIIADAALTTTGLTQPTVSQDEPTIFPLPVFSPPLFSGPVAVFHDDNPLPPTGSSSIADFTATINWGDGTPPTTGTIVLLVGGAANYEVTGSHTYADAGKTGSYNIQVFVIDDGGSRLTIPNTATVTDNPITVTGAINPASVSGLSTGDPGVTNVTQPDFSGTVLATLPSGATTPEAYAEVSLTATNLATGVATPIGSVQAGSGGAWNITSSVALPDGTYSITATSVDQFGQTITTAPDVITSSILIDTVGPVIDGMFFNRINGQVDFIIKDPVSAASGAAPSGVWVNTLLDSSNYFLTKVHANKAFPGKWYASNVTATPDPTIPNAYDVAVTFNGGASIRGGFYLFTIRDSSNGESSVQDRAENHLDGVFYGSFPSGNGINGSDFVAELQAYHNKVFAPQTIIGTSSAADGGSGGKRVAPVHSGIHVPAIPRGGAPIFSTPTSPSNGGDPPAKKVRASLVGKAKHKEVKHAIKVKAAASKPAGHAKTDVTLHDLAIMALVDANKTGRKK